CTSNAGWLNRASGQSSVLPGGFDPVHDPIRGHRQLVDSYAERAEGVLDCAGQSDRRNHSAAFTATLDAILSEWRRRLFVDDFHRWHIVGGWQQVVHKC